MIHTDARFSETVEAEVARLEAGTDAEVVVVAAARSGEYRDVVASSAAAAALTAFLVMLAAPVDINPLLAVVDLVVAWGLARWLLDAPWFLKRVVSATRMNQQAQFAAAAEFHLEAVHGTPGRTGLLIYISALEGRVELIPDVGLEARIPRGRWAEAAAEFAHDDLDHFVAGLRKVGELLAEELPQTDSSGVDLANAPRIRH